MRWYEVERAALADTLLELGPDAPTVCEGWRTRHLAAHLYLRQNRPTRTLGAFLPPFAAATERAVQSLGDEHGSLAGYARLVADFVAGPGRWSPMRLAGDSANLAEYVIHHEDARRGTWPDAPRPFAHRRLPPSMEAALRRRAGFMARMAYWRDADGVVLCDPDGTPWWRRKGPAPVVVTGPTIDLLLHASGRARVADVEVAGTAAARDRFLARHVH